MVENSSDFKVRIYVTKKGETCDPEFLASGLSVEAEAAVVKGLMELRKWQPGAVNGKESDSEYIISKSDLLGK